MTSPAPILSVRSPMEKSISPSRSVTITALGEECSVRTWPASKVKTTVRRISLLTTTREVVASSETGRVALRPSRNRDSVEGVLDEGDMCAPTVLGGQDCEGCGAVRAGPGMP